MWARVVDTKGNPQGDPFEAKPTSLLANALKECSIGERVDLGVRYERVAEPKADDS